MIVRSMMKLLHCVLFMLNFLYVIGHEDLKHLLKKWENEDNFKESKNTIYKIVAVNDIENIGSNKTIRMDVAEIISLINTLNRNIRAKKTDQGIEIKDKKKNLENNDVLLYDLEGGHLVGRSENTKTKIGDFINNLSGTFNGNVNFMNKNMEETGKKSEKQFKKRHGKNKKYGKKSKKRSKNRSSQRTYSGYTSYVRQQYPCDECH